MPLNSEEVMNQFFEAGAKQDMDKLIDLTHEDCVISEPKSLPYGGKYAGKEAFAELFQDVFAVWEEFEFEPAFMAIEGDNVFIVFDVTATVPETEEVIETQATEIYTVRDGKISELNVFYKDTTRIINALGDDTGAV